MDTEIFKDNSHTKSDLEGKDRQALIDEVVRLRKKSAELLIIAQGCGAENDKLRAALKGDAI